MTLTFNSERLTPLWDEMLPLLGDHYREIARYQDIDLAPDIPQYNWLDEAGLMRNYTVRDDGKLVGYAVFFVKPHLHYMNSLQAMQDVVYLDPVYRGGRTGLKLLRYAEGELKKEGVQVIMQHVKQGHPALGVLLEYMGYEVMDVVYTKRID